MSSKVTQSSSEVITNPLNGDEKELWELCYYAGVTLDLQVGKIIMDLLGMDIHPKAILEVLEGMARNSKYMEKSKDSARDKTSSKIRSHGTDKTKASGLRKTEERSSKASLKPSSRSQSRTVKKLHN